MSQESMLGPYLKPGTPIKVGSFSTKIVRYLSEGGFSHVYIAKLDIPVKGSDIAVLKRIVAPDKTSLAAIRTEVDTMKKLKGHRYIVTYIDSHASAMKNGGYEVYVLMEYCPGGGLIDFMNTRLQTRLAEWEVLKIISDTTEAVACMHYLRPPLLHRDLKIENVLISGTGDYKLCDFGSCTEPRPAATNSQERRTLEEDIQKNTTIQYRSPEMVDVSRKLPIDEKSDIWALGVLLYKLCYFTTPFETQGPLAILNAAYTFPPYPPYTDRTKRLIAVTLQENPRDRPNIYQLLAEICAMRNVAVPVPDIYSKSRSSSQGPQQQSRPSSRPSSRPREDVITYEPPNPVAPPQTADIVPMRRGRPERTRSGDVKNGIPETMSRGQSRPGRDGSSSRSQSRPMTRTGGPVVDSDEFATKFPSLEDMDLSLEPTRVESDRPTSADLGLSRSLPREDPTPHVLEDEDALESVRSRPQSGFQAGARATTPLETDSYQDESIERVMKPSEIGKSGSYLRGQVAPESRNDPRAASLRNTDFQNNNDARIPPTGPIAIPRYENKDTAASSNNQPTNRSLNPYSAGGLQGESASQLRPPMVSRSSQTSPKANQAVQTQTSPAKPLPPKPTLQSKALPVGLKPGDRYSIGKGFTPDQRDGGAQQPAILTKPQFKFTTSVDRPNENQKRYEQLTRPKSASGVRPMTIHLDSGLEYLRDLDSPITSTTQSDSEPDRTGPPSVDERATAEILRGQSDALLPHTSTEAKVRRSVSVSASGASGHGKRPSISSIPSFSGAAKSIMNSKFGDAFKKFESSKPRGPAPASDRANPLQVAEADLPDHVTQHLQTTEARRSLSYNRSRPSLESLSRPNSNTLVEPQKSAETMESSSTSVKEAMRRLQEKASQKYVPQRSAQGYGKYTDVEPGIHRAATVIPQTRVTDKPTPAAKPVSGKNMRRYALQDDDDDSTSFSQRYPSLSDFKV